MLTKVLRIECAGDLALIYEWNNEWLILLVVTECNLDSLFSIGQFADTLMHIFTAFF